MAKRFIVVMISLGLMLGYYLASPLLAAIQLRQAIQSGDTATIAQMVNWPSLRASVRRTISRNAKLLPAVKVATSRDKPSLWQRIRSAFGRSMLDSFIDRYITPDGLVRLYHTKTRVHETSARFRRQANHQSINQTYSQAGLLPPKVRKAWNRVKRAEFLTPFQFQFDMQDRHKPTRMIKSTFHLTSIGWRGLEWQLTAIAVRTIDPRKAKLARLNGF